MSAREERRPGDSGFVRALGLLPATTVNMAQMVGIGPFITIPLMITAMGGPQALLGWIVGALLAMADGLVWAELGAAMPAAGGSYVYLREAYQYSTGRLMPFMFIWSTLLATPLIMSTGMIGMADYLNYFFHLGATETKLLAVGLTILTVGALYRRIENIAKLTRALWVTMLITVGIVIVASMTHFRPSLAFDYPSGAFAFDSKFFAGLGAGLLIAIYDYLGYFTAAYLGDEVEDPGRVIPRSIIYSIIGVAAIYFVMNLGVLGVVPWQEAAKSSSIGTLVLQRVWGSTGAAIITVLIVVTAFASVFAGLLGGSRLPYNAARDRLFFAPFGLLHERLRFPHVALLVMGLLTAIGCFFTLDFVLKVLIAVSIVIQFIGQIGALVLLRKHQPELERPYRQWLFPIPSVIALIGWVYIFLSSGWTAIRVALVYTALGLAAYLLYARREGAWPFGPKEVKEVFMEEQLASGTTS